jgi:hypothetical protein
MESVGMTKEAPIVLVEELPPHVYWAVCKACSTQASHPISYHPEIVSKGPRLACGDVIPTARKEAVIRLPRHLHRTCQTCGFEWMEGLTDEPEEYKLQ